MHLEDLFPATGEANASVSVNFFKETEFYFLEAHVFNMEVLVVVFEPAGGEDPRNNGFRTGWGVEVLRKRECSVLSVKPKRVNWYVTPDLEVAFSEMNAFFAGFRRVVTYGVSMGGYGALCYADRVLADEVFAFSPQTTLDPAKIQDDRFPRSKNWDFSTPTGDVMGRFRAASSVYIFYDKNAPLDRIHVHRIRQANVFEIHIPGSGHSSMELTRQCGALRSVIDLVSGKSFDWAVFYQLMRSRKESELYRNEIHRQWERRRQGRVTSTKVA